MIKKSFITKEYYKPKDVSNILGVSTRKIQNYCNDGKLGFDECTPKGHRVNHKNSLALLLVEIGLLINDERIYVVYDDE